MEQGKKKVFCPLHGHLTVLRHLHTSHCDIFGDYVDEKIEVRKVVYYYIAECEICNGPLVFSAESPDVETSPDVGELLWPVLGVLPKCVPKSIARYYLRAKMKMNNDPQVFAHNIRLGLEAICNDRRAGTASQPLAQRIDALAKQDGFPELIRRMMQALKNVGNFGAHVSVRAGIKSRHVPAIDMFFRGVVEYVYIAPVLLKEFDQYVGRPKASGPAKKNGA